MFPDRYFSSEPTQRSIARSLYAQVQALPLVCPHGHVDPALFADPNYTFGSPVDLLLIPDHYIFRMLYSQGIPLESLGIQPKNGKGSFRVESDHRKIWQIFADHFHLFMGTPTGAWLRDEFAEVFGITRPLKSDTAQDIYTEIATALSSPNLRPRQLYEDFRIEVLCTTDAATDTLDSHQKIRNSDWKAGRILPTFRPDSVVNLDTPDWLGQIHLLEERTGKSISSYSAFIQALEDRRAFFKQMGAKATDHAALSASTHQLTPGECEQIFQRALQGGLLPGDSAQFTAHMLIEMGRMSVDDGLVMQLHVGSFRNHNPELFHIFGPDKGADIPTAGEFTQSLKPLLDAYGSNPRLRLILFTLDEATYARELAPLAGHYPALLLGPPWWFHDSIQGMERYLNQVMETAGIYNTAGFNDDTRAYLSIPARHDLWRRVVCNWVAGLVVRHIVHEDDAHLMTLELSYNLARRAYRLDQD